MEGVNDAELSTSPEGTLKLDDQRWVKIQENTFTNWINQQLRDTEYNIDNLRGAFTDGVKLCALVAVLQGQQKIAGMKKTPKNRHEMIENVTLALNATKQDKVKIVNIGAEDIVNDNQKLLMGLVWSYIVRYQIGKTKIPPKQLMLAWLKAVIPDVHITDFTTDWNDGTALHALIDYCEPGLSPNWRNLDKRDRVANCEAAMRLAQERLGVPMVVSPQDMASVDLDRLSGMTYLSYFMKLNSCGYKATLRDVNKLLSPKTVSNFTSDWRDGSTLCNLVQSVGGHVPGWPDLPTFDPLQCTKLGITASRSIGIEPILSAEAITNPNEGHLGVMAHAARFIKLPVVKKSAAHLVDIVFNTVDITVGIRASFNLIMKHEDPRFHAINVKVLDGNGNIVPHLLNWKDDYVGEAVGTFVPSTPGVHNLIVECDGDVIRACPIKFNVGGSKQTISLIKKDLAIAGQATKLELICDGQDIQDLVVMSTSPSGEKKQIQLKRSPSGASVKEEFVPDTVGKWQVDVLYKGETVAGSPHVINVIKPEAVKLYGVQPGVLGKELSFMVDTTEAGKAELQMIVSLNGQVVPSHIIPKGEGHFQITFVPSGVGSHLVRPIFGGQDVRAEPYSIVIAHSGTVEVSGPGIKRALVNQVTKFNVEVKNAAIGQPSVVIKDPSGKQIPCNIREEFKGQYSVSYTPLVAGAFHVEVLSEGKHVSGSPFTVVVNRLPTAQVPSHGVLGKPVIIELHTTNSGTGELNISVNDGTVQAQTRKLAKDHFIAEFIPGSLEPHIIDVEFNSIPLIGSPWTIDIEKELQEGTNSMPIQRAKVGESRSLDVSAKKAVELNIVDPKGKPVPYSLMPTAEGMSAHYTFSVVGDHQIHVKCDGKPVKGSPFLARVFDPLLVYVKDLPNTAQLNQEITFSVDTRLAGEGTVSVLIDEGQTLCSVTQVQETLYKAKFVASKSGANQVCVMFNNCNVKDSPFTCNVEGLSFQLPKVVPLNQNVEITLLGQGQVPADLNINITDPKGKVLAGQTMTKNGISQVLFKALTVGQHNIEVVAGGKVVPGGPYQVSVIDPSRLIVSSYAPELQVNKQSKIIINDEGCGSQDIRVQVYAPDGSQVQSLMTPTATGYELTFMPTQRGIYSTKIMLYGIQIRGSPLQQTAKDFMVNIVKPIASGLGLHFCEKDKTASFLLRGNQLNGQPDLRIEGPHSVAKYEMQKLNDAEGVKYEVTYTPVETGIYSIYVKWNGNDMEGSPFHPHVIDPRQVTIDGDWYTHLDSDGRLEMKLGQTKKVLLDVTGAGPGELSASGKYISSGNQLPIKIVAKDQSHYWLEITPVEVGEASINVLWSDRHVLHSPIAGTVIGGSNGQAAGSGKVVLTGNGLESTIVGKETEFFIDGIIADSGSPGVILKSSQLQHMPVTLTQLSATEYKCTYSVDSPGTYMLHISWNGKDLSQSPYTVIAKSDTKVSTLTGAEAVKVYGIGINPGVLYNYKGEFFIDTKSAGKGQCSIKMIGPKGDVKFNAAQDQHDDRLLIVRYEPTEIGIYIVQVKWSNEDVPQSPIKVYIFDTHEELNRFTTVGELPYHFTKMPNFTSLLSDVNRPFSKVSKTEERKYKSLYIPRVNESNVIFAPPLQRAQSARANGHPAGSHMKKLSNRTSIFIVPENAPNLFNQPSANGDITYSQSYFIVEE